MFVPKIAAGKHALPLAYYDSIADISNQEIFINSSVDPCKILHLFFVQKAS